MDSCINYINDIEPRLQYRPGYLFLDNGAFSANLRGTELNSDHVILVQEALRPSLTIPLDYPFNKSMSSVSEMRKRWQRTKTNILYWQNSTSLQGRLVPSLHAWSPESLKDNVGWIGRYADADTIALGSLVDGNSFSINSKGYFGDREPTEQTAEMILTAIQTIKRSTDFEVHLMGFGASPLMLHLSYFMGVDSTDSSGPRRKAAFGKIVLQSTGERYLGVNPQVFGKGMSLTAERGSDVAQLDACSCEICLTNRDLLWQDWRARAMHNEHVMKMEQKTARFLLSEGEDVYAKYLDLVFSRSSLKRLWKYIKFRKRNSGS